MLGNKSDGPDASSRIITAIIIVLICIKVIDNESNRREYINESIYELYQLVEYKNYEIRELQEELEIIKDEHKNLEYTLWEIMYHIEEAQ